jgi:hypothetical protein
MIMCIYQYVNDPFGKFSFPLIYEPLPENVTALSSRIDSYIRQHYHVYYGSADANLQALIRNNHMTYMDREGIMDDPHIETWFNRTLVQLIELKRLCRIKYKLQYKVTTEVITTYIIEG